MLVQKEITVNNKSGKTKAVSNNNSKQMFRRTAFLFPLHACPLLLLAVIVAPPPPTDDKGSARVTNSSQLDLFQFYL